MAHDFKPGEYVEIIDANFSPKRIKPGWRGFLFDEPLEPGDVIRVCDTSREYIYYYDGDGSKKDIAVVRVKQYYGVIPRNTTLPIITHLAFALLIAVVPSFLKGQKIMNIGSGTVLSDPMVWKSFAALISAYCLYAGISGGLWTLRAVGNIFGQLGDRRRRIRTGHHAETVANDERFRKNDRADFDEEVRKERERLRLEGEKLSFEERKKELARRAETDRDQRLVDMVTAAMTSTLVPVVERIAHQEVKIVTTAGNTIPRMGKVIRNTSSARRPCGGSLLDVGDIIQIVGEDGDNRWRYNLNGGGHNVIQKTDVELLV